MATDTPATNTEEQPTKKSQSSEVLVAVSERLGKSGEEVRNRVVNALVEREVASRVELLDKALAKRIEGEREIKKLSKPDVETYDMEGKVVSSSFSKARADELKKAREAQAKLEGAIDKALNDNDFSKLKDSLAK